MITVADVLRDALPRGTLLVAGRDALARGVSWASALHLRGGFTTLEPGAIALLNLELLALMPARPSAAQAIAALGRADVAAVALRGCLEPYQLPMTRLMAERAACALLQLPGGKRATIGLVEAGVNAYLASMRAGDGWQPGD